MGKKVETSKNKQVKKTKKQQPPPVTDAKPVVEYGYTVGHLEPATQMEPLYTGGKILFL